jgi:hypothetical protein
MRPVASLSGIMQMRQDSPLRFPTTRWTMVEDAAASGTAGASAIASLLGQYLTPLRAHLVHDRRLPAQEADDLLQGFVADKVLESELLARAAPQKGRFRTFLLVALDRYVSNQLRNESRKVTAPQRVAPLDEAQNLASDLTPSAVFEVAWARQVLANAACRMKEQCDSSGRGDVWGVFEARVLAPTLEGAEPESYEQLVARLNLTGVDAASNLLVTAKRMFARSLRGVVGEYMGEGGEVDQEIADLRAILARGNG